MKTQHTHSAAIIFSVLYFSIELSVSKCSEIPLEVSTGSEYRRAVNVRSICELRLFNEL